MQTKAHDALRVFSHQALDFWLQKLSPTASVNTVRASVRAKYEEAPGVVTIELTPNHRWKGFTPGQHVELTLEVDGRRLRRTWTLSGGANARSLQLTISKIPGGRVTPWVHEQLNIGDVVELSQARGTFVRRHADRPTLFLAGGVGITPALAMIRTLTSVGFSRAFTLVHYVRDESLAIARAELDRIQARDPLFRYVLVVTEDDKPGAEERRVSADQLSRANITPADCETFVCGPAPFMDAAEAAIHTLAPDTTVAREYFTVPQRDTAGAGGTVHFARSNATQEASATMTLLETAEAAGLTPKL